MPKTRSTNKWRLPGLQGLRILLPCLFGLVALFPAAVQAQAPRSLLGRLNSHGQVLTVYGHVFGGDGDSLWADGDTVLVENLRTHAELSSILGGVEPGWYAVAFVGYDGDGASAEGDTLRFTLLRWGIRPPKVYVLQPADLDEQLLRFDLRVGSFAESGACCIGESGCTILPEARCWNGTYLGHGRTCDPNPCGPNSNVGDLGSSISTALDRISPNPFRDATTVEFRVAVRGEVSLVVFDAGGRRLRNLAYGQVEAGRNTAIWDGRDNRGHRVLSGVYFVRLLAPGGGSCRPVIRLE
jgi:hypothetical protein